MSDVDARWVAFVRAADRSGTLTALSECFSTRGVSFDAFSTLDVHGGEGLMAITFRGSARLAQVLVRTLERFTAVREVRLERADDERVRAMAVVRGAEALPDAIDADVVAAWGTDVMIGGSLRRVEHALASVRLHEGVRVALTVLPPTP